MTLDRVAVLSDVHGNLTAFRAVLADIESRGIETVINLGDVAGKGPRGSACVALSRERCAVTVRGNWDDFLPNQPSRDSPDPTRWWREELSTADRDWLRELPFCYDLTMSGRGVRMFHASAASEYTKVHFRHDDDEFAGMFEVTARTGAGPTPTVVCYGDLHDAYIKTSLGRTLINVGSVGSPMDETTASYVVLEGVVGGSGDESFSAQFVRIPFDIEAELAVAVASGMPMLDAYTTGLRTAVYHPYHDEPDSTTPHDARPAAGARQPQVPTEDRRR